MNYANDSKRVDIITHLLAHGADLDSSDQDGDTMESREASTGYHLYITTSFLLQDEATDVDPVGEFGRMFIEGSADGHAEAVSTLHDGGEDCTIGAQGQLSRLNLSAGNTVELKKRTRSDEPINGTRIEQTTEPGSLGW